MDAKTKQPLVQINCYDQLITLTRRERNGQLCTYPIDLADLALHLNHVKVSSGFLPASVLAWGVDKKETAVIWYVPKQIYTLTIKTGNNKPVQWQVPLPAAVLSGKDKKYTVYAVKRRPRDESAKLYHYPAPNVGADGSICKGNRPFPAASIKTMPAAWQAFVSSGFSGHWANHCCRREPENVLNLWQQLHEAEAKRFPKAELLPMQKRLRDIIY